MSKGWALVPPAWLCDLGQATFPLWAFVLIILSVEGRCFPRHSQLSCSSSPPPKVLLPQRSKRSTFLKPKVPGQADARSSRLLRPQPFNSSLAVWASRLWHLPGFVSSTWAGAQISGLARPGFRGKGLLSQPGHLEVRQALVRDATPQRAPPAGCFLRFSWPGQSGPELRQGCSPGRLGVYPR